MNETSTPRVPSKRIDASSIDAVAHDGPPSARAEVLVRLLDEHARAGAVNAAWLASTDRPVEAQRDHGWLAAVHEDDREAVLQRMLDAGCARRSYEIEYRIVDRAGRSRTLFERGCPLWPAPGTWGGYLAAAIDIGDASDEGRTLQPHAALLLRQMRSLNLAHVVVCDPRLRIIGWHDGNVPLYGYPALEALGADFTTLLRSELPLPLDVLLDRTMHDRGWQGTVVQQRRNGSRVTVESQWLPVHDAQGRAVAVLVVESNRAALRAAEHALHAAQRGLRGHGALLEAVSNATRDCIYVKDREGRMLFANPAALRVLAREEADVLGRTSAELIDGVDSAIVDAHDRRVIETGCEITVEESMHTPSGPATFLSTKSPLRDEHGQVVGLVGVSTDITDRKRAERELVENEQRYRAALRAVVGIVYEWDAATGVVRRSEGLFDLIGVAAEAAEPTSDWWFGRMHPDDRERVRAHIEAAIAQNTASIQTEYRVCHAQGHWVSVWDRSMVLRDDAGQFTGLIGNTMDVTHRKRAEERLRLAVESTRLGLWEVDLATQLVEVSDRAREICDLPPDALVTLDAWRQRIYPLDLAEIDAAVAAMMRDTSGESHAVEYRVLPVDPDITMSNSRWVLITGRAIFEGQGAQRRPVRLVGTVLDITARKRAEHALRDSEERLRLLVENIDDVFWIVDYRLRRQIYVSPAYTRLWGFDPAELYRGDPRWSQRMHPDDRARVERAFDDIERTGRFDVEYRIVLINGGLRWVRDRGTPVRDARGRVVRVLGVAEDVTARVMAQRERDELLGRERASRAQAEAATQARDQFLAIVSHELRSPLNGIQSWAHVLESQIPDDATRARRALQGIRTGVEQQVRLIEDLLDATRIMSGSLSLLKQPVALLPVVEAALASVRASALAKDIALTTRLDLDGAQVDGDRDRLQQIVWNLLSNAVKFTPPHGRVELAASIEREAASHAAVIVVSDSGKGIPSEFLPHMFEWFRRSEAASNRSEDGLGLGLALVRHLTELHDGSVEAASEGVGQGATFTVRLPLRAEDRSDRSGYASQGTPRSIEHNLLHDVRVLLVDDQLETRDALATVLGHYGAQVVPLASGRAAVAWIEAQPDAADVLVCDIAMPDQDGHATLQHVRAIETQRGVPTSKRLPAIALSAFTQREDRIRALATGFQVHIGKPVSPDELVIVIAALAGRSSTALSSPI